MQSYSGGDPGESEGSIIFNYLSIQTKTNLYRADQSVLNKRMEKEIADLSNHIACAVKSDSLFKPRDFRDLETFQDVKRDFQQKPQVDIENEEFQRELDYFLEFNFDE